MDHAITFGEFDHLFGVATEPPHKETDDNQNKSDVAVIFVTAGMLHNVGASRMHVQLAHELSSDGYLSFRFDLSGIGESLAVGSCGSSLERAREEIQNSMDCLQDRFGIKQFVLFGLCSGADDSMFTALSDERVVGTVLIDGCGYKTSKFAFYRFIQHYLPRLVEPKKIANGLRSLFGVKATEPETLRLADDIREFPDRDQSASDLQALADRGVKMRFIYTGGVGDYYNYEQQFQDMFHDVDFKNNITSKYFSRMDHLATLREDRAELFEDIRGWIANEFSAA